MKKLTLLFILAAISGALHAQNSIGLQMGFLGTHTSIAEYERIDRHDFLIDSMTFNQNAGSFQAALNVDFDLGKSFFFSTGFHYCNKGLSNVTFTDSAGWPWTTAARQKYVGISFLLGYKYHFSHSKYSVQLATGPNFDVAVGTPNGGALFSGPYYRFFMPFSRFNELDLNWMIEAGVTRNLGPGDIVLKLAYLYGLSDVFEDAFVVGRTISFGISLGYSLKL